MSMAPDEKRDLLYRCRRAISAPVPESVRSGGWGVGAQYLQAAQVCSLYVRTGRQADRAYIHLLRLEAAQGLVRSVADAERAAFASWREVCP